MFNLKSTLAASLVALTAAAHAGTNLVGDGSFVEGATAGWFATAGTGASIGPWSVTSGSVDLIGTYWNAPSGYSIDLDGNEPGVLSQDLSLGAAGNYVLMFSLAGNPDGGSRFKTVDVSIGDVTQQYTFDTAGHSGANMGWVTESLAFTAVEPDTTLTFSSADAGGPFGAALANISVTAVPEPASAGLLAAALAMFGVTTARRNRRF